MKKMLLTFVSMMIVLSTLSHAEVPTRNSVTKLYVATFKRAPDAAGLDYWLNSSGLELEGIASSFFDQPETQEKYPEASTNTEFVIAVYDNLFNRTPDQDGLDYWVSELDSGRIENSVFILAVINGAQNTEEFGNDLTILENKTIVGLAFADAGLDDVALAIEVMVEITDEFTTVESALEIIELASEDIVPVDYISLLGGKTFYQVEKDENYVAEVTINADVTEKAWTLIIVSDGVLDSGTDTIIVDGDTLHLSHPEDGTWDLVFVEETTDYLLFLLDNNLPVRFYFEREKALEYYNL